MKFAVLGLGFMGSTHLKALRAIPGVEVAAVCSLDERALTGDLSAIQGNIGGPGERQDFSAVKKYRDPGPPLADPEIDAVDICLPTNLHAAIAIEALRAGKHVLVEKPMALDGATADAMVAEAEKQGRILMAAQVVRFIPAYAALRNLVRGGELGAVRSAAFRRRCAAPAWGGWLMDPKQSGGGIFDLLIHDVDFCLHLLGNPEAVLATGYENLALGIDCVNAQLFYPQGVAAISGGWHHPKSYPFSADYTVVADGGTVEFNSATPAPMLYAQDGASRELSITGVDGYAAEVLYFVECCRAGSNPALCPPAESADAVKMMRLIEQARARSGEKIECRI
jgi:predicted dehydrogenase